MDNILLYEEKKESKLQKCLYLFGGILHVILSTGLFAYLLCGIAFLISDYKISLSELDPINEGDTLNPRESRINGFNLGFDFKYFLASQREYIVFVLLYFLLTTILSLIFNSAHFFFNFGTNMFAL